MPHPSSRVAGRLAALLFVASGAVSAATLPLPQPETINRTTVLIVSFVAVCVGLFAFFAPWQQWHPRATLVLLPPAFALITIGNYWGGAEPYTYSIFFVVAFAWIGLAHPRWTSLWFVPMAAAAYVIPLALQSLPDRAAAIAAGAIVLPVCVAVAEGIAWMGERERRSREQTSALAAVATALGPHLNVEAVCETLAREARVALRSEFAAFVQLGAQNIDRVCTSGFDDETRGVIEALHGTAYDRESAAAVDLFAGQPVIVEDAQKEEAAHYLKNADELGLRSYIGVPVMVGAELVGVLALGESVPRHYTDAAIQLAQALAAQASAALRNAMQFEKTLEASRSDVLTGLGNRRAFHESFETEVERAMRYDRPLSLVVMDVDTLKQVNDAGGHAAGDRVLERIAVLLEQTSRREDGVFRIGGDEFALVLPETAPDGANVLAERVRRTVERGRVGTDGQQGLTLSLGVASLPMHAVNPDELFERADTAMYEVKRSGGNAVSTASLRDEGPGTRFGVNVREVIDGNRLVTLYQPVVHLVAGVVLGYEGMTRIDPSFGIAPTATLFRAAGALGLTEMLDRTCRRAVIAGAKGLHADHFLFVNIAPAAIESEDFDLEDLLITITNGGLDPEQVVLEVTEHQRTLAPRLVQNLERCSRAGIGIALDDFSAARTDADLASSVRFDYLKVDTGLIAGDSREARRPVLRGLLEIARDTGAMPIAEGVETLDDLELVRELGFDAAQGFFVSDPAPTMREPKHIDLLTSS